MKIRLNGREADVTAENVADLVSAYNLDTGMMVVEKNGSIVHREDYRAAAVSEGDVIEIVRIVGGG
ncbi:MAG: sulfur carrier protein ThiS [Spirochaetes bacterium]|nr:sulfur carrier protein ThiS [Spirochaetota bacterium]